jgi:hypothetical protein
LTNRANPKKMFVKFVFSIPKDVGLVDRLRYQPWQHKGRFGTSLK